MRVTTWARIAACAVVLGSYGFDATAEESAINVTTADTALTVRAVERGLILTPGSTRLRRPGFAHTNHHLFMPRGEPLSSATPTGTGETPASLACIYGLVAATPGCPQSGGAVATGGARTIVIVDAYHYPTAANDLQVFSAQFGLPAPKFSVVYASGKQPPVDGDWAQEEALDIEMAHALAPSAPIVLVEAASAGTDDLAKAVRVALSLLGKAGGYVSMSWGGFEFASEISYQPAFNQAGAIMVASSGDNPGPEFPSVLPNVIAVGGTTINRDASGNFTGETAWAFGGGGQSRYIARPTFQAGLVRVVGSKRGVPDIALEANPASGVWAFNSGRYTGAGPVNWFRVGGTSVAAPLAAALLDVADSASSKLPTTAGELAILYQNRLNADDFIDITSGSCSNGGASRATIGYDLCTGIGTPFGLGGK